MVGKTRRREERSAKRGKALESLLVAVKVAKELKKVVKVDRELKKWLPSNFVDCKIFISISVNLGVILLVNLLVNLQ